MTTTVSRYQYVPIGDVEPNLASWKTRRDFLVGADTGANWDEAVRECNEMKSHTRIICFSVIRHINLRHFFPADITHKGPSALRLPRERLVIFGNSSDDGLDPEGVTKPCYFTRPRALRKYRNKRRSSWAASRFVNCGCIAVELRSTATTVKAPGSGKQPGKDKKGDETIFWTFEEGMR